MSSKRLGIIGGMGPKATAVFFDRIVDCTAASSDQEHIDAVILNHTALPDRTSIILSKQDARFLDAIANDLRLLEYAGVDNIAIPCNTSHYFYDEMQKLTAVPIIHMVDETIKVIHSQFGDGTKVGLLATNGTVGSGVYSRSAEASSLRLHVPNDDIQQKVMDIIYNDVKRDANVDPAKLEAIIEEFIEKEGCSCVILACTELSCIKLNDDVKQHTVDAMEVLVRRSIELSGKQWISRQAQAPGLADIDRKMAGVTD